MPAPETPLLKLSVPLIAPITPLGSRMLKLRVKVACRTLAVTVALPAMGGAVKTTGFPAPATVPALAVHVTGSGEAGLKDSATVSPTPNVVRSGLGSSCAGHVTCDWNKYLLKP